MRKIFMTAAIWVALAGVAEAQGIASQTVTLNAFVDGYCTIDGTNTGTPRTATVSTVNGKATPGVLALSGNSSKVSCTGNAEIKLTTGSGGLANTATLNDPGNYTNKIHYTATASYNGAQGLLTTSDATGPGTSTVVTTAAGPKTDQNLDLVVTVLATGPKLLINGSYQDILTVTLTPKP